MKKTALLLSMTMVIFASQAQAKMLYAKAGVGVGLLGDVTTEAGSSESTDELDTSFPVLLAVGFKFSPMLAIEGEFSYRSETFSDATSDGDFSNTHFGVNMVLDIPVPVVPVTPYFGGGALVQFLGGNDNYEDFGTGFSLQFFAGASYAINPLISVGLDLRYLLSIVDPSGDFAFGPATVDTEASYSQLSAIANVMFGF